MEQLRKRIHRLADILPKDLLREAVSQLESLIPRDEDEPLTDEELEAIVAYERGDEPKYTTKEMLARIAEREQPAKRLAVNA